MSTLSFPALFIAGGKGGKIMALDIEGHETRTFGHHMPVKPEVVDGARFRRQTNTKTRTTIGRAGGAHISSQDPEIDLKKLPKDVQKKIQEERGKVHNGRAGKGSAHIFTVTDENGVPRTIIDL